MGDYAANLNLIRKVLDYIQFGGDHNSSQEQEASMG